MRQGEPTRRLFLIVSGTVRVLLGKGEQVQQVARLQRGAWIGETALLTGSASSTTVVAESDVRVLTITHEDFLEAAKTDSSVFREIARELAGRLRSSDDLLEGGRTHRTVALLHGDAHAAQAAAILEACERWSGGWVRRHWRAPAGGGTQHSVADYVADPLRLAELQRRVAARLPARIEHNGATGEELASLLRALAEFAPLVIVAGAIGSRRRRRRTSAKRSRSSRRPTRARVRCTGCRGRAARVLPHRPRLR